MKIENLSKTKIPDSSLKLLSGCFYNNSEFRIIIANAVPKLFTLHSSLTKKHPAFAECFYCYTYALSLEPKSSIFSRTVALIASEPGARSFLGSKPLP